MRFYASHKRQDHDSQNNQGFTFVEVAISIAIILISLTAVVGLMNVTFGMSIAAENRSDVTDAISKLADQLRATKFSDIGNTLTYVSDDGHVNLTISILYNKALYGNVKIVTISGISTGTGPQITESDTIIIKATTESTANDNLTGSPPPVITLSTPNVGAVLANSTTITVMATQGSAEYLSQLTAMRVYIDATLAQEYISPASGNTYSIAWNTKELDGSSLAKYPDGISTIKVEVTDRSGNKVSAIRKVVIDNLAPSVNVSGTNINVNKYTNTITWTQIKDPYDGSSDARRYKLDIMAATKNGGPWTTTTVIVPALGTSPVQPFETKYVYPSFVRGNYYQIRVTPGCAEGCIHASASPATNWGTPYALWTTGNTKW